MDDKIISLNVDESIILPIVKKKIEAKIAETLITPEELVEKVVSLALKQKVNKEGKVGHYSSDNSYDFLEIITKNAIQEKAREALKKWLDVNSEKIKQAVLKELNSKDRQKTIAKAYLNAIENSLKCNWRMNCNISFSEYE
jgi:hypothetical protein